MENVNIRSMNTPIDGSGTITAGGTSQNLFGSGATLTTGLLPVNGFEIINPDATEDLWITDSPTLTAAAANAAGCVRVAANGGSYWTAVGYKPLGIVRIVGATTGHKFTARAW